MLQMRAAIPLKSLHNPKRKMNKKPMRSSNESKKLPNHEEENRDSEQQPKTPVDKSVEKSQLQTLKSLNERISKEKVEIEKEKKDLKWRLKG